jgi:hypothetical protein
MGQTVRQKLTYGQLFANHIIVLDSVRPDLNLHIKDYGQYRDYNKTGNISDIFHVRQKDEELRNVAKAFTVTAMISTLTFGSSCACSHDCGFSTVQVSPF